MATSVLSLLAVLAGVVVLVPAVALALLVTGIRTQNPRILGAVRRFNRSYGNRAPLRVAGKEGSATGLLYHRGRTSGREYATPIGPGAEPGGFAVMLPYGPGTDWLRNLRAAGSAVLRFDGRTYRVDRPEVVPVANTVLAEREATMIRIFGARTALRLRATEISSEETTQGPARPTTS
ncbi:hypothetical protein [Myceligenerans indicum]|uniref:Nitroreductase family deazaflavin-dependent oxidoreductase n=1 Tax=Myceligenerans indicum TaxID=2593663 RepID=A0ABS1LIX9_9MICO|nr:hypothetical protein [Myceligenerans indicum]MBL0885527.1 nitroreductase family deazaflavin-dependent oxidoreductase [Myceligenerans indicum]